MPDLDPRLAQLYDGDNPDGPDHDHYRALVDELGARDVVDLGCGTGLLTVTLAGPGRTVTGIDPSTAMLAVARSRPGTEQVTWLDGDSRRIRPDSADVVLVTGNAAQQMVGEDWHRTLADVHRGLRPGGVLAFERRNPAARAWEGWTPEGTTATRTTHLGELREWMEPVAVEGDVHRFACHTVFTATGEHVVEDLVLSFRDEATVRADLTAAGFAVRSVRGGWDGGPVTDGARLLVVHAVA